MSSKTALDIDFRHTTKKKNVSNEQMQMRNSEKPIIKVSNNYEQL